MPKSSEKENWQALRANYLLEQDIRTSCSDKVFNKRKTFNKTTTKKQIWIVWRYIYLRNSIY